MAQGAQQQNNIAEEIRSVMQQMRELKGQIDAIAGSFPVASQDLDGAKTAMDNAIKTIIANQTGPEPPATRTLA